MPTAEATTTLTLKATKPTPNTPMLEGSKKKQGTWGFIGYNEETLSYDSRSIKTGKTFRVHSFRRLKSVVLYCDEPTTALTDDFKAETDHEEKNHPHVEEDITTPMSPTSSSKPVSSEASPGNSLLEIPETDEHYQRRWSSSFSTLKQDFASAEERPKVATVKLEQELPDDDSLPN